MIAMRNDAPPVPHAGRPILAYPSRTGVGEAAVLAVTRVQHS
jgi:hypothetical protein